MQGVQYLLLSVTYSLALADTYLIIHRTRAHEPLHTTLGGLYASSIIVALAVTITMT